VFSDRNGRFILDVPGSAESAIVVDLIGYEQARVSAADSAASGELRIALREAVFPMDAVVTTATRSPESAGRVPASVETIAAGDARLASSANIGELLSSVSGIRTTRYGAFGDVQTASIRGSSAGQVLVLVDGHRINDAQSGEVDLSSFDLNSIRRVEVVRGGASALYGPDAVGGVVNIVTHDPWHVPESGIHAGIGAGSFGYRTLTVGGRYAFEDSWFDLSYRHQQAENEFAYTAPDGTELHRSNADVNNNAVSMSGGTHLNDRGGSLNLTGDYFVQQAGDPGSAAFLTPAARKENRNLRTAVSFEQPFEQHVLSVQGYVNALRFGYANPDPYFPIDNDSRNTAIGGEIRDMATISNGAILTFGASYRSDRCTGNSLSGDHARGTTGLYVQSELHPLSETDGNSAGVSIIPAIRWDKVTGFDGRLSPKLGLAAFFGQSVLWTFKGNVGTSYRAPAFNDLYWPNDGYTAGNSNLVPERSVQADLGLSVHSKESLPMTVGVTGFINTIRDLILWQSHQDGHWSPENVGTALIRGVETEIGIEPVAGSLYVEWSYTMLNAEDRTDGAASFGNQLAYRPNDSHTLLVRATLGPVDVLGEWKYTSRRFVDAANTLSIDPFHTTDLTVTYSLAPAGVRSLLMVSVRNLEDNRYQTISGYPVPGRELRCSVEVMR
jgi:outer membrane cobalamin receptor